MRSDLGTWRGPQAQAVVRALKRAGLTPQADETVGGTRITVPDAQNDAAHEVLVRAMDDIARVASAAPERQSRAERRGTDRSDRLDDESGRPLVSERLRNLAPLTALVVALVIAAMIPAGGARTTAFVFALVGFGVIWARRHDDGGPDDDYGRGPR